MRRFDSVDVLRAIALIAMIICHYPIFLSSGTGGDAMLYFFANHLLGGDFAAAWFVFLVGISQVISARKREITQAQDKNVSRVIIRGMAIFMIGLLFLFVVQGYEELWVWDILTFIGATTIILLPCRKAPSWVLLIFCLAVFFITPWLRSFIDIAPFYGGSFEGVKWISDFIPNYILDPVKDYEGGKTVLENAIGFFLIGQFPLLPWIIIPLIGFVVGRRMTQNLLAADSPFILMIGMMFTFMGLFTAYAGSIKTGFSVANDYITPLSFYPISFSMIMLAIGVLLILFICLWRIFDAKPDNKKNPGIFLTYCRQISKYSLTIYITHFALIFIPLRIIQAATGTYHLRNLVSTPVAFSLAVLLLILYYPVLKLWDKVAGKYSFEWLLAKLLSPQKQRNIS
jgi:uncharacterized membrane protein